MARPRSDIRLRVVSAARTRFLSEGVDGASLRKIAKDAGTSVGMVYYYFPTKDDLFLAVVEEVYAVVLGDLVVALDPELPVEERILRLYSRIGSVTEEELVVIRLVVREALVSSARLERVVERFQRGHLPLVVRLIADGVAGGTFDPSIHPLILIVSMIALGAPGQLLTRFAAPRVPFGGAPEGTDLSKRMVRTLLHGVGANSGGNP